MVEIFLTGVGISWSSDCRYGFGLHAKHKGAQVSLSLCHTCDVFLPLANEDFLSSISLEVSLTFSSWLSSGLVETVSSLRRKHFSTPTREDQTENLKIMSLNQSHKRYFLHSRELF